MYDARDQVSEVRGTLRHAYASYFDGVSLLLLFASGGGCVRTVFSVPVPCWVKREYIEFVKPTFCIDFPRPLPMNTK